MRPLMSRFVMHRGQWVLMNTNVEEGRASDPGDGYEMAVWVWNADAARSADMRAALEDVRAAVLLKSSPITTNDQKIADICDRALS